MKQSERRAVFCAIAAAALYALNSPVSKLLLNEVPSTMMAALLYLGAGLGLLILRPFRKGRGEHPLAKKDLPYTIGMVLLDIAAPICLMFGLARTTAANASLLNNFEIVATALIALLVFREQISKRLWASIFLVTVSSILLTVDDISSFSFSIGSVFVLLACVCWGFENNCTRMLSQKDPLEIVIIKGFGSGLGSLVIALAMGEQIPHLRFLLAALLLGFFAYGLSICFYIYAQRELGAAKTSTYYALAPFIGVFLSFLMLREPLTLSFGVALAVMVAGAYLAATDTPA